MKVNKFIFFDGVDGAGKTYKIRQLLETNAGMYDSFRPSCQIGSRFANRDVDLEESIKHDWRMIYDFYRTVSLKKKYILVDRGFISSYVYSKVIRQKNIRRYIVPYLKRFRPISEFWFFFREDSEMSVVEKAIDQEYREVYEHLEKKGFVVKDFYRKDDNKFRTDAFLDYHEEISSGRLDTEYYSKCISRFILELTPYDLANGIIVSDLDGTLIQPGYPRSDWEEADLGTAEYILSKYPKMPILIVTGRTKLKTKDFNKLFDVYPDRLLFSIINTHNVGLSSRVLKAFCLGQIQSYNIPFLYLDDREDVVSYLFKSNSKLDKEGTPIYVSEYNQLHI